VNDRMFFDVAARAAVECSHDHNTQNGAVLLSYGLSVAGANMYRHDAWRQRVVTRDDKLLLIEHAERVAIYEAAKLGQKTEGGTLFALWAACPECARAIVGAGITRLVTLQATRDLTPERWAEPIRIADRMLAEAGVRVEFYTQPLGVRIRFDGRDVTI
jgi:dCMP deaminase